MSAPRIRVGQRWTDLGGQAWTLDAVDGDVCCLEGPRGRSRRVSARVLLRDYACPDAMARAS